MARGRPGERVLFGMLIIAGYYALVGLAIIMPVVAVWALPPDKVTEELPTLANAETVVRDALLVIGPLLGVIVTRSWREERQADLPDEPGSG